MQFRSCPYLRRVESLSRPGTGSSVPGSAVSALHGGAPMILTIERKEIAPDVVALELTGRIILGNNSRDVELKLGEILHENIRKIIFDLKGITMLDSTGVGILVVSQAKIKKEGGELRIAGATGVVEDILKMTSVEKLVRLFPTVEAAAANF